MAARANIDRIEWAVWREDNGEWERMRTCSVRKLKKETALINIDNPSKFGRRRKVCFSFFSDREALLSIHSIHSTLQPFPSPFPFTTPSPSNAKGNARDHHSAVWPLRQLCGHTLLEHTGTNRTKKKKEKKTRPLFCSEYPENTWSQASGRFN